jgi:Flp pilus assembly protein TadG
MIRGLLPYFNVDSAHRAHSGGLSSLKAMRLLVSRFRRALLVETGDTMVEFALSTIVLCSIMFGVIAICLALYTYNVTAESAREATRYAIVRGSACSASTFSNCNIDQGGLQTYVRGIGFPGINPSSLTLTAAWPTTGVACFPSVNPCNNPGDLVQVTVTYQFPLSIPFIPQRTLSMSSTSEMVISQ